MPTQSPDPQLSMAVGAALMAVIGWIVSISMMVLKGKEFVEVTALRVLRSAEGRAAVLEITGDKHANIEEKIDALGRSVERLVSRLEERLEQMERRLDAKLERLDGDARNLDRRLSVVEASNERA